MRHPWFWLLAPPVSVVVGLLLWRNVFLVFAVYQVGFCLLLPALRIRGRGPGAWREHVSVLGLSGSGTRRGIVLGAGLALLSGALVMLAFRLLGAALLAGQDVSAVLAGWGVGASTLLGVILFMVLVSGPAEEVYWRGFVHSGLRDRRPRRGTILLIAACYASYHGVTVFLLLPEPWAAATVLVAILGAGFFWGWLREKTGSVWPALLSHWGATAAYMWAAWQVIA